LLNTPRPPRACWNSRWLTLPKINLPEKPMPLYSTYCTSWHDKTHSYPLSTLHHWCRTSTLRKHIELHKQSITQCHNNKKTLSTTHTQLLQLSYSSKSHSCKNTTSCGGMWCAPCWELVLAAPAVRMGAHAQGEGHLYWQDLLRSQAYEVFVSYLSSICEKQSNSFIKSNNTVISTSVIQFIVCCVYFRNDTYYASVYS
jgi:hypothetical protein